MNELVDKIPFNCIITGPTNCGKTQYIVDQLRGHFRGVFDYIVLICPTYIHNKTYKGFAKGDKRFWVLLPDSSNEDEIDYLLTLCSTLFSGENTLIILDDCAVSKDLKNRTNKFINLAFSGRLTSISKPFRENVACVVSFYNPSETAMKMLFEEYGGALDVNKRKRYKKLLETEKYARLCFSLRHPFEKYLEIPASEAKHG